jgi:hypothetical protein
VAVLAPHLRLRDAAASASTVAAMFLIAAASSSTPSASRADTNAGSKPVANSFIALRTSDNRILPIVPTGCDNYRPRAIAET